jgi:hypothetical protein
VNLIWVIFSPVCAVLLAAVGELVSEEIRARLDRIPLALLAAAAKRLPSDQRAELYEHGWLPELHHILRSDEAMPITRLLHGTRYATRLWLAAPTISRELASAPLRERWLRKIRQALRDGWTAFVNRPSTYGDQLFSWCLVTSLVYGIVSFHGQAQGITIAVWGAGFFGGPTARRWVAKRARQDPPLHASVPEVVICWYILAPALAMAASFVGVIDILTLVSGHGSVRTWFGLIYGVLYVPWPWLYLRKAAAWHARQSASTPGVQPAPGDSPPVI